MVRLRPLLLLLLLAACGRIDYDATRPGAFSGTLFVMWVGEGGPAGDGRFVYVPNPRDPLIFTRPDGRQIRPRMMYTDGGSIPRIGQVFRGFSPWGYAPAYMVHDWLFVARHCRLDGLATPEEQALADIAFSGSAQVIAEAIKTLQATGRVAADDVAPAVIASAVAGPVARSRWDTRGACAAQRVIEADRKAAEAGIPGASAAALRGLERQIDGQQVPVRPAVIVGSVSF